MSQFFSHIVLKGKNGDFAFSMHTLALDLSTLSVTTVVLKIAKINNTAYLLPQGPFKISYKGRIE